jgi:hypothetical protein
MRPKIGVVMVGTALAIFVMGRVDGLRVAPGFGGSWAWAQETEDPADDAAISQDDAAEQNGTASPNDAPQEQADAPDSATDVPRAQARASRLAYCLKHPFPASGIYSGTFMDNNQGAGMIGASLFQCYTKLSGTWGDDIVPPAFWNGTISSSGKINAQMRFHISGKCGYTFNGTFINGNEISGNYTLHDCKGMGPDGGSFQMFKSQ